MVDPATSMSTVSVLAYDDDELVERRECRLSDVVPLLERYKVLWVNIEGLGDRELLAEAARVFQIHPLALEDVVNVPQRPKVETYPDQLFVVVQLLEWAESIHRHQMSLCLGSRFVVTFQEKIGDPFEPVRQRLRSLGRLRGSGPDYLAYALIDAAIDHYFPVLEKLREHLEDLESQLRVPHSDALGWIQRARTDLSEARRAVGPVREVTRSLLTSDWPLISDTTRIFLRDCRDHALEASDMVDGCREVAAGLMDIHLSTVSHQANRTMKLLTVIATIFMPLSFLAGLYGMNFDTSASPWNMPELGAPWGYPVLLGVMSAVGFGLAALFWKKGWFD